MRNAEQNFILGTFVDRLALPTGDGGNKRQAGSKVHWLIDQSHKAALFRHLERWLGGETEDPESGAHPLDHVAWRALAIAEQEARHKRPADPPHRPGGQLEGQMSVDDVIAVIDEEARRQSLDRFGVTAGGGG